MKSRVSQNCLIARPWVQALLLQVVRKAGVAGLGGLHPVSPFGSSLVANWLIGLMLLIVAAGYQRGVELAEDAELTV